MATLIRLEGTDLILNLNHVITIQKAIANDTQRPSIVFNLVEQKEVLWQLTSEEARDEAFESILEMSEGKVF